MDFMTLDSIYYAETLIEGYRSLIWTERFPNEGEFQLRTPRVAEARSLLPEGTLVTVRESEEVMIVETHSIETNDKGVEELVVKGRSFDTFTENRHLVGYYQEPYPMLQDYTVQDALMVLLYARMVNTTMLNLTGAGQGDNDPNNAIPNLVITDGVFVYEPNHLKGAGGGGTSRNNPQTNIQQTGEWWLEPGPMHPRVMDFLNIGNLGIRTIRPKSSGGQLLAVSAQGVVSKPAGTIPDTKLRLHVYNGRNRTTTPTPQYNLTPVVFRADAGHVENPSYLFSKKDFKNVAFVNSTYGSVTVHDETTLNEETTGQPVVYPSGLGRRVIYVDAGTFGDEVTNYDDALIQKGRAALRKHARITLMEGAISVRTPYVFGTDYSLGDYVTLIGKYGVEQDMQVVEYIRVKDESGSRSYPTLIAKQEAE
jgi:hypothetical protein